MIDSVPLANLVIFYLSFPSSSPLLDLFIFTLLLLSILLFPDSFKANQCLNYFTTSRSIYNKCLRVRSPFPCLCRALVRFRGRIRLSFSFFVLLFFLAWSAVFISKQQDKGIFPYANVVVHGNVISLKQLL